MKINRPRKVLIIDEINYTRLGIDYALTSAGYKVTSVRNGAEALQSISVELPDVILLSLRHNDSAGILTLKDLKEYFRLRLDVVKAAEPPIVVLSASKDTKQVNELQYLGVSAILFKPINMRELSDTITDVFANRTKTALQEKRRILIFDSEARVHQFMESILVHETYDFETSESEAEMLAKVKNRKFDLAILDISSFEGDVTQTIKHVKEIAKEMLIVTVSAFEGQISPRELDQLGVQAHFTKPIPANEFQRTIDRLMETERTEEPAEQTEPKDQEKVENEELMSADESANVSTPPA